MAALRYVLLGPTASGKTAVSLPLAEALRAEIVSVDSRQLYRGLEIGSAAPGTEERARVPHHLIGEVEPDKIMTAGEFGRLAQTAERAIRERGWEVLLVGGSGLYLRAALGGLDDLPRDEAVRAALRERAAREGSEALHAELAERDPETAAGVSPADAQRITRALEILTVAGEKASVLRTRGRGSEAPAAIAVLDRSRQDLEARIRARVGAMVEDGLEVEVRALLARGLSPDLPLFRSLGYAETIRYLAGELDREAWLERIAVNTRRFAKRQRTWFRSLEGATWIPVEPDETPETTARRVLAAWEGTPAARPEPEGGDRV